MPKVRLPDERAVAAARGLLAQARVGHPDDICVEHIAARSGAYVLYVPMSTARGAVVRAGKSAIIHVDERLRGRPAADFTIAHETLHHALHALVDHYAQCTASDVPRTHRQRAFEREANDGATELLVPEALGAPFCRVERATVDAVVRLSRAFRTSFEMSAIRMTELTMAPCAIVVSDGERVRWALESLTFPGAIGNGRRLHPGSLAASMGASGPAMRDGEVVGDAWKAPVPLVEHAWRVAPGKVVSWIAPA